MKDQVMAKFQCPRCKNPNLRLSSGVETNRALVPEHGYLVCDACHTLYPIAQNILDMTIGQKVSLTLAGVSNAIPPAPRLYEPLWRRRSLTLLTGEAFFVEREYKLLNDWTQLRAGEAVVDLGTSTGLYARGLKVENPSPSAQTLIFGVDTTWGMLTKAKQYIAREKASDIVLVRAAAENLPFRDESIDAVVVGGSLNEMQSMRVALEQAQRITRRGGRMFVMSLSRANKNPGQAVQKIVGISGIQFPSVDEFNRTAQSAGWTLSTQVLKGIVLFSLLRKASA